MNLRLDLHLLGWLLLLDGAFLVVPAAAAILFGESVWPFAVAVVAAAAAGGAVVRATRGAPRRLRARDGLLVVGAAWIVTSCVGAVPYLAAGALGPADALFEAVSGFTTTGSTVIADVTVLPRSLLLWRAMTQWLGGMGIILFTIAILPLVGIGGMQLFKAEVPGPVADKVQPRLAATARSLWLVYVGLSAAEWVALRVCGVGGFEALCHVFTTMATGGFSTRNRSVGELGSPAAEWVIVVFMLAAGTNFVLHYRALTGRVREALRDEELRWYLGVIVVAVAVVAASLHGPGARLGDTVRTAAFQVVSIVTTTGYVTADFEVWPHLAQLVLLVLMVLGGMSGSTGGGIKTLRLVLAARWLRVSLRRVVRPHAVVVVKHGGRVVPEDVLAGVWAFLTAYAAIAVAASLVLSAYGYDLLTSVSAALTAVGNVGPGIGTVGAYDNFAHLQVVPKLVLAACMLLGRLEIFTLLAWASRTFWRG